MCVTIFHDCSHHVSGTASNVAVMVATGDDFETAECKSLISRILATKEFDKIEQRADDPNSTDRDQKIKCSFIILCLSFLTVAQSTILVFICCANSVSPLLSTLLSALLSSH